MTARPATGTGSTAPSSRVRVSHPPSRRRWSAGSSSSGWRVVSSTEVSTSTGNVSGGCVVVVGGAVVGRERHRRRGGRRHRRRARRDRARRGRHRDLTGPSGAHAGVGAPGDRGAEREGERERSDETPTRPLRGTPRHVAFLAGHPGSGRHAASGAPLRARRSEARPRRWARVRCRVALAGRCSFVRRRPLEAAAATAGVEGEIHFDQQRRMT